MLLPSHVRSYDTSRMTQAMIMPCHARSYKTQIVLWSCCLVWSSKSSGMTQPTMLPCHFWSYKVVLQTLQYWIGEKMYVKRTSGIFCPSYIDTPPRNKDKMWWKDGKIVLEARLCRAHWCWKSHSTRFAAGFAAATGGTFTGEGTGTTRQTGMGTSTSFFWPMSTGQECKECQYQDVQ